MQAIQLWLSNSLFMIYSIPDDTQDSQHEQAERPKFVRRWLGKCFVESAALGCQSVASCCSVSQT